MSQPSEKVMKIFSLSQKGDSDAFDELAGRYWNRIHRFLLSMFDHASAADVTQQALIRAHQKIHLFNNQQAFAPWLFTLTRRVAINVKKKENKRKETTFFQ